MIGVFDSGFGGLTVLREFISLLPAHSYIYLGDSARAPYGPCSKDEVYQFTKEAVTFLFEKGCNLVILACNTASSDALRRIQQEFLPEHYPDKRVLGVLVPSAEEAAACTKNKKVGVIGTDGTISSGSFDREILKLDKDIKVFKNACPLLVPIIEGGLSDAPRVKNILSDYLLPIKESGVDTLILGCTHYSIINNTIMNLMGGGVEIVLSGEATASRLVSYLERHKEFGASLLEGSGVQFFTTGDPQTFDSLGKRFYGSEVFSEKIDLK